LSDCSPDDWKRKGKLVNFATERAIGTLGNIANNHKNPEGTFANKWLLTQVVHSHATEYANVMDATGTVHATMSVRDMISQGLFPAGHVAQMNEMMHVSTEDADANCTAEAEAAAGMLGVDRVYGPCSYLHPLRTHLPVHGLHGSVGCEWVPQQGSGRCLTVPHFVHPMGAADKNEKFARGGVDFLAYGGPLLPAAAEKVHASAVFLTRPIPPRHRLAIEQLLWSQKYTEASFAGHRRVGFTELPVPSRGLGASQLVDLHSQPAKVWLSSGDAYPSRDAMAHNNWTGQQLRDAIRHRLEQRSWERFASPDLSILSIGDRVTTFHSYQIGGERFASAGVISDSRAHVLIVSPERDNVVDKSQIARTQSFMFRPHTLTYPAGWDVPPRRAFLHPAYILRFLEIPVELCHRDWAQRSDVRRHSAASNYHQVTVPVAVVRFHQPHDVFTDWDFGDLAEIWDTNYAPRGATPADLAEHIVPLNRIAGKFAPARLHKTDYGVICPQYHLKSDDDEGTGMMVLRIPLK